MEKTCILYIDTNPLYNHLVVFKLVCNHFLSTCLVAFQKIICKHLFTYSSYMLLDSTDDAVICECRSKVLKFDQRSKMFWNLQCLLSKFLSCHTKYVKTGVIHWSCLFLSKYRDFATNATISSKSLNQTKNRKLNQDLKGY